MAQIDPVIFRQLPVIKKVIADETWLEGERRGCYVPPDDPVVRENVCAVILRIGRDLRESIKTQLAAPVDSGEPSSPDPVHHAAA